MSVTLLVQEIEGGPSRLLPISTQDTFTSYWIPVIEDLGLEWIGLAETGFFVTAENRDEVLVELRKLHEWFVEHSDVNSVARLDPVVAELENFVFENGANAYLG